jgi:hypothetical protein
MISSSTRHKVTLRSRAFALSMALWLFGIFTSMVLIGLWGRSVAGDQVTLEASTRAVLESEIVNDRVTDWLGDAVAAAAELSTDEVAAVVDTVGDSPQMQVAVDDVVDQAVAAALAPPGTVIVVDLSAAVESLAPVVAAALEERGVVSGADTVRAAAHDLPGIVLSADDQIMTVGSTAREVKGLLSKVVVVGLGGLLVFGGAAVMLNDERIRQLRALVIRIGVSAFTFAIVIRIGGWAVDPAGGRSPIAAGGAVLLKSNGHILVAVVAGAAVVAAGMSIFLLRRRRGTTPIVSGPVDTPESPSEQPVLVGSVS